ncbi:MAG: response regulator transcription factor [Chloroflexota bacterium]
MPTIVLADDHHVVRQGLRTLLEIEPDFSVIGEAADGLEVLGLVNELHPDVLVVDLIMPGLNGLDIIRQVAQRSGSTRMVVLSMHANAAYVSAALKNGATAYVLKGSSAADLVRAVREVVAGRRYLSPPLSQEAIEIYEQKAQNTHLADYPALTVRETEILQLVAEGHTNSEVGLRLSISPRTVETHRRNLMRKLNLRTQSDLIRYALRHGMLPLEE